MGEKALRRKMKSIMRAFRSEAERAGKNKTASEWLRDNFYILEREARQAVTDCAGNLQLKKGTDSLPCLFGLCKELCENGVLPDNEKLAEYFSKRGLSSAEAQSLYNMLRCALLDYAYHGCTMRNAAGEKLLGNSVKSIRRLAQTDFEAIIALSSEVEKILMQDPAGIYPSMETQDRAVYRRELALLAEKENVDETEYARRILGKAKEGETEKSRHVGSYIVTEKPHKLRGTAMIAVEIILPLLLSAGAAVFFGRWYAVFLWLPLWEVLKPVTGTLFMHGVLPKRFFRIKSDDKRVENTGVLITVSTLLTSAQDSGRLFSKLNEIRLANSGKNVKICCLADYKNASSPVKPEDSAALAAAKREIDSLNEKHSGGFLLAVRPRVYSKTQREFSGRERKRGAITELVRAIKGDESGFQVLWGDKDGFSDTRYLLVLDSDTKTVFDTARELVSVALHPLNTPEISDKKGRVVKGYAILAPKVCNQLIKSDSTAFERLLAGTGGINTYDLLACEKYQDLFCESIFSGKGLIDVDAYYKLLDKAFPKERVLSHDILEGGYLRTGFVSDLQLTDGFPSNQRSFFARHSRWVRGDWQNIPFIFGKNPLNLLSRWKLFDNLRRSITPVISTLLLLASVFMPSNLASLTVAVALLSAAAPEAVALLHSLTSGGFSVFSRLYYSKTLPSALLALVRAFLSVIMLAQNAFVSLDAIVRACWRMAVSKKNLLEWTTAAQSESKGNGGQLVKCLPSAVMGILLLVFPMPAARLAALFILADIPFAVFSAKKPDSEQFRLSYTQKESLLSYTAAMWAFFDENCNRENSFLIPDNIQETPVRAVAKRTSPTNIGMLLVCMLAARDLGYITSAQLYTRLNLSLASIEKMPKYKGNLYNWYSTEDLSVLSPAFVSTVDSGNFLCCLTALRSGLREYRHECEALSGITDRITAILDATDLAALYNPKRNLFYIGVDAEGNPSENYYDLFMSEARMTAYYAVAKRIVPKKHWGMLGRILVGEGRYTGLVSWTGTMFEYFMPYLFIPSPVGSLCSESLEFCLWCQRKNAVKGFWGISESGFFAFDSNLNYQYKAHGVQRIGLKRDLDREKVIAPYATFLALTMAPNACIKNLKQMENAGLFGKYGFYEAADFTKGRCHYGEFSTVSSYMAHHVGMSMLSAMNVLKGNIFQKRFMADDSMAGAQSLLNETVPNGARVFKDIRYREVPKTHERTEKKNTVVEKPDIFNPVVHVYSNGRWSLQISDSGAGCSVSDGVDVICRSDDILQRPSGIFAVFEHKKQRIPFTKCIDIESKTRFKAKFGEKEAVHVAKSGKILLKMHTSVLKNTNGELRRFTVENLSSQKSLEGSLLIYCEPCLEKYRSYASHPMFSKLFLTDEIDKENKMVVFSRRFRENPGTVSLAVGFLEDIQADFETSRERVLACGDGIFSLVKNKPHFHGQRGNPDACAAFRVQVRLKAGEKKDFTLALTVQQEKSQAKDTLLMLRVSKAKPKKAPDPFYGNVLDSAIAMKVLPAVFYPGVARPQTENVQYDAGFNKSSLWSMGISGDNPIVLCHIESTEESSTVLPYVRINKLLRSCGFITDLVITFEEKTGYELPIINTIRKMLRQEDCEPMLGVNGGIFAVNLLAFSYNERVALENCAVLSSRNINLSDRVDRHQLTRVFPSPCELPKKGGEMPQNVKLYNFTDGKISIESDSKSLAVPWCAVFANKSFGTMVSDKSLGFTWALNSRENKLTPWRNDTRSDNRGEVIFLKKDGKITDIVYGSEAVFTPESASWHGVSEKLEFCTNVRVANKGLVKKITVKITNYYSEKTSFELAYFCEPVLDFAQDKSWLLKVRETEKGAVFTKPFSQISGYAALQSDSVPNGICFDANSFFCGKWDAPHSVSSNPCVSVIRKFSVAPGESVQAVFYLSWGRSEKAALNMPFVSNFCSDSLSPIRIKTENEALDLFFNSFLYSQIRNSRFFGRTGFYQCSGAWGFRDQLQDSLAFIYTNPEITRTHLIRCAAVQFEQGDVLHWWHVITNKNQEIRGIRTRCSDDMLWLCYVLCEYAEKTGDKSILHVKIPFLIGEPLGEKETERYFSPVRGKVKATMMEHCLRAADKSYRLGSHSLPLIGSCDWNDGFSRVGMRGAGESVWLAEFQIIVFEKLGKLCREFKNDKKAVEFDERVRNLKAALEKTAVDGSKFIRAFDDSGCAIGADASDECKIDILPQAFAVFSGAFDSQRRKTALQEAVNRLVDEENSLIKLLTPPFTAKNTERIGYIAAYPEGIRENGGQYTHAAVWLASACLKEGMRETGMNLMDLLNPVNICKKNQLKYRGEPYVLAGDVLSADGAQGRAGWTHYTGSAAWYYLTVLEDILGIKMVNGKLVSTLPFVSVRQGVDIDTDENFTEIRRTSVKTDLFHLESKNSRAENAGNKTSENKDISKTEKQL